MKKINATDVLFAKVRELLKSADSYAKKKDAIWLVVYLNSAQTLAKALRELEDTAR